MAEDRQHQALYRRYRPQTPAEVLGQDHVVRALTGAIRDGRLHHAFLFCGPRGTGKTSTARILAKMVNCEQAPTAEPCGKCEQCLRIRDGSHLDVVEIDAASHGGVDDARELRERAPTAPAMGREKVYILDEAQRLSREAFDALLKLFEEPPPGVRFVLCTTEPHKMPATIVGRCQRFDFRRGTSDVVAEHLGRIAKDEGVQLSNGAALAIARQAEGSFRDALSLLDQATVLAGGKIDEDVLESLLGAPKAEVQYALADAVSLRDTRAVFVLVDQLVQEGHDLRHVTAEALKHYRNLLLAQTAPGQTDLVDVPADEYERLRGQAAKFTAPELSRIVALLLQAQTDMRWTTSPRLTLELALVRASMPESDPAPEALISRLERLERLSGIEGGAAGAVPSTGPPRSLNGGTEEEPDARASAVHRGSPPPTSAPAAQPTSKAEPDAPPSDTSSEQPATPATTGDVDVEMLRRSWHSVVERLKEARQMPLAANLESVTPASFDGETLELAFPPNRSFGVQTVERRISKLQDVLRDVFGITPAIKCVIRDAVAGAVTVIEDDDTPPPDEDAALARLQAELNAEIADGDL
jgi:DNA polymerase III subunit gamma/tau